MSDHEHEHEGEGEGVTVVALPNWRFSPWDVVGITLLTTANVLQALSGGVALLSQEFAAQANRSRHNFDLREAQRLQAKARQEMAASLRDIVEGDQ